MALASIFMVLAESGLFFHQSRTFPSLKQPEKIAQFLADGIILRLILGIVAGIILIIIGLISGKGTATFSLICLLAMAILFSNLMGGYSSYLYGNERFGSYGILSGLTQLFTTCLGFLALSSGWGLVGIGLSQALGALVALIVVGMYVRTYFVKPEKMAFSPRLKILYKNSLPLGLAAIIIVFYNRSNFALVSYISGDSAAGIYNAAFALINGAALIASTLASVMLPRFSGLFDSDKDTLTNLYGVAFNYLLIFGAGIAFGVIALGEPLITALFSDKYALSAKPLLILSIAGIFLFLNSLQQVLMMARRANRQIIKFAILIGAINLITCAILIPRIGYMGAAIAMLIGEAIGFVYGFAVNLDILKLKRLTIYLIQIIPASIVVLFVARVGYSIPLIISVLIAAVLYCILLFMMGSLTKNDLAILIGALKK
jgi:O-antigen/teichoic acid export membrane protein